MTRDQFERFMGETFTGEIQVTREQGQKEYARTDEDAFANFKRVGGDLGIDPKQVLWVYAMKHRDGIASFLNGHTLQREPVQGRIKDLIVYLFLLWGMVEEERFDKGEDARSRLDQIAGVARPLTRRSRRPRPDVQAPGEDFVMTGSDVE